MSLLLIKYRKNINTKIVKYSNNTYTVLVKSNYDEDFEVLQSGIKTLNEAKKAEKLFLKQ